MEARKSESRSVTECQRSVSVRSAAFPASPFSSLTQIVEQLFGRVITFMQENLPASTVGSRPPPRVAHYTSVSDNRSNYVRHVFSRFALSVTAVAVPSNPIHRRSLTLHREIAFASNNRIAFTRIPAVTSRRNLLQRLESGEIVATIARREVCCNRTREEL